MNSLYEVFESLYGLVVESVGESDRTLVHAVVMSKHREYALATMYCLAVAADESVRIPQDLLDQASQMFDENDPDDEIAIEDISRLRELNQRVA
ncbi:hypothetical protein [Auritidibacter ignavus]|uniref:hypothetical protein n=1 Tax=Auritidibacter ignavus TaxID=678932 RepID=UPI002FE58979